MVVLIAVPSVNDDKRLAAQGRNPIPSDALKNRSRLSRWIHPMWWMTDQR
jgi:hypothetical protein